MVPYGALSLYTIVIYIYIYLSTENWNCTSKYGSPRTKGTEVTEEEGTHRINLGNKQYWILPSSSSSLLNRPDVSWMDKHRPPPILPLMLQSFLASTGFLFFFMRVNIIQDIYVHSKTLGLWMVIHFNSAGIQVANCVYIYLSVYTYIHIYICIERERTCTNRCKNTHMYNTILWYNIVHAI